MQQMQPYGNRRWEGGRDDVSFEDSERFEEDSQGSLDDSLDENQHNWRGWADCNTVGEAIQPGLSCVVYQYHNASGRFSSASTRTVVAGGDPNNPLAHHPMMLRGDNPTGILLTLSEIAAKICAEKWSFQQLEDMYRHICETRAMQMEQPPPIGPIPEKIFVSFIVHCFPQSTDEIRMYSCLANGSADQYEYGKMLYHWGNVRDVSQTGFLLSGDIYSVPQDNTNVFGEKEKEIYHVTVKVDRCRIVECTCECSIRSSWCKHVVALCIYRISERSQIKFKETIADAINSMSDKDLRKLVQWHINDIPRKCIPGFQKLIDQIKDKTSMINLLPGAPDPTDGGHEPISRYDFPEIESKIRRLLIKYCVPAPAVHCDVQYLATSQHPTHVEWTSRIKPLRCREPEGLWNLLQMVREMFARNDDNSVALLRTVTDECLSNSQVLLWWYITKLTHSANWTQTTCFKAPDCQFMAQIHCAQLCDELVMLWRLAAMNPRAGKEYRSQLAAYLQAYHQTAVTRLKNMITAAPPITNEAIPTKDLTVLSNHKTASILQTIMNADIRYPLSAMNMRFNLNCFPGFHPAIQMCHFMNEQNIRFGVAEDAIFSVPEPNLTVVYKMVPVLREKTLKKKKKKKRQQTVTRKRTEDEPVRPEEFRGVDGVWRVVEEGQETKPPLNDSTESGQESDVQRGNSVLSKKRKGDFVEMDVNEVLAAAFTPLDTLEAKFLRVEAYGTHGYRADAVEHSLKVIEYLIDSFSEQAAEFRKFDDDEGPSTSKQSTSSSSSSNVSDEVTGADREEEVTRGARFLATMEKILYITKVLKDSPNLQHTVFDVCMRTLEITKWPLYTQTHQMMYTYLETEFVAILEQLWQSVQMTASHVHRVRSRAEKIIEMDAGNNGELPPIAFTKFLFLALYWTESLSSSRVPPQNATTVSPALQANRRLLISSDSDLALHISLHIIGCRPLFTERYHLHWETVRREKSELTSMLLVRYKDSQERCALVLDQILDPKLHRMYQHHLSNAAYFLERCPEYVKRFKRGQRPVFPYKDNVEVEQENPDDTLADYQAQIEAELVRLKISDGPPPAPIGRKRSTDDGVRSSSSSEFSVCNNKESSSQSGESVDLDDPNVPGTSGGVKSSSPRKGQKKKRSCRSLSFDPGNTVTDAAVYHMQELSKKILFEAGGTQNNSVWGGHNLVGTNRRLHLCAIAISIYALGMSNRISPSWNTRTYSTISSWITTQIDDIGASVLEMIREIWMAHFTPTEICQCSDKVAPSSDPAMRHEAARLSLSVLPFAHALTDDEVIHALKKCQADSRDMSIAALLAMDTPHFREIARSRCLWEAMQHWHELSYAEERQQQQQQASIPPGMVPNPFANPALIQQQQNNQQQQQRLRPTPPTRNQFNPPLQQVAWLYPQVYVSDQIAALAPTSYRHEAAFARFPQSRSAPQLVANEDNGPPPAQPPQQANHQFMVPPPVQGNALLNAWHYGMRAMECLISSPGEDRQLYLKFTRSPPYSEEVSALHYLSLQLGTEYLRMFYFHAAKTLLSPYVLHHYAKESVSHFPHISQMFMQQSQRPSGPVPLIPQNFPSNYNNNRSTANVRYPNVRFCSAGTITNQMIQCGYQEVTGELFERCIEQYLQAICNKMNSPHSNTVSSNEFELQLVDFVRGAYDAFQCIPHMGRQMFEEFVRTFKRQKSYKKECQQALQPLLHQLCISN
ncbi:Protein CBR-PQN-55 [Caenorhabditis briggsae]|uniref:Protein CBR-PQN-55 n=1 Tax=Caenorhabditis briggsae TaxID=6238 RepID=A8WXG5_CAEBR|nr:Protein CBR-PQN-55 [Caenorhabditis briggsae]CAP25111.1 Protein CBR-PQN-55 [Caenorhabditis briggsae]